MHVPDGFFTVPMSLAAGAVAASGVAYSLRKARDELDDRMAPLAGLVAAFVFAVQMLNFPVGAGTSGHLIGGALAAILVGPYTGVLCIAVVVTVQALFFADGGLTALGINISLMGLVTVLTGYGLFRAVGKLAPRTRTGVVIAAFAGAMVSVPMSALAFTGLYAIGGTSSIDPATVAAAMGGVHVVIGLGEGAITALTVSTVLAVRPDLVYGARSLARPSMLRTASGELVPARPAEGGHRAAPRLRPFLLGGVAAAVVLAGLVSFYASANPDGLERVATDLGFLSQAQDHPLGDSALADYTVKGVEDERLSTGLAGALGVGVSLAVGAGVAWALRRRARRRSAAAAIAEPLTPES
ncbi:energy-coupling factor ABC transporter permease [Nonomuraea basaltis]|uniref:energy-coupling factor ABC transporter permease n=1 Tax=Nonomuraea basaltis TaxID=2495887 RepID=UPI00110C6CE4|nr:energy-coupling factor ABC transporter permease [Nonomuraea basaltis]TMR95051.1 cobalt ABC transporter permease [Nonomuraea basaltis]